MSIFDILLDGFWAALAATGFAAVSNPPKKVFIFVPIIAALGHMTRFIMIKHFAFDIAISTFVAALIIGTLSVHVGVYVAMPSEVFSFPSLLPMIPGLVGYKALLGIIKFMQSSDEVIKMDMLPNIVSNMVNATLIMFALGVGVSVPMLIFQKKMDMVVKKVHSDI